MARRVFVDTNVLVYCYDVDEPKKRARALDLLDVGGVEGDLVLSTQVLQEFYVTVVRKLERPLSEEDAEQAVRQLASLPVVQVDTSTVLEAIRLSRQHRLSLWDALILQAARAGGCSVVLSEDLQDGLRIGNVRVENPFRD